MSSHETDFAGPVDMGASLALLDAEAARAVRARAALAPAVPAVVDAVRAGRRALAFTFAGQGAAYLDELAELHAGGGAPRRLLEIVRDALVDEAAHLDAAGRAQLPLGIDFLAWLAPPPGAPEAVDARARAPEKPDAASLARASSSAPLLFAAQMARLEQLFAGGLDALFDVPFGEGAARLPSCAGHSQGVLGALGCSAVFGVRDAAERAHLVARLARAALHLGIAMERSGAPAAPPSLAVRSVEETGAPPSPMAAVSGATLPELRALLHASGAAAHVAVENAPLHHTLAGAPAELERLRRFALAQAEERRARKKRGLAPGRIVDVRFQWLPVSGPFHTSMFDEVCAQLHETLAARALALPAGALKLPVLDGEHPMPDDGAALARAMSAILVRPQSWRATASALGADLVIDCGPGVDVAHLSSSALRGRGSAVLAVVEARARKALLDAREAPEPPAPYAERFAPVIERGPDGRERFVNRFVRATGRPPVLVPGMTPTTVEAPIVVAAANAGFVAELAGGGQVTTPILRARLEEVRATLQPGQGIVFNALYLDPYLWGLHFKTQRTVFALRDEGYPILGVTVSAGVPPLEEAVALLDDLVAHGMTLNAFKPGNDAQLDAVLAIADARPAMTLFAHIEGGKAGGHHSWEDLDDLLVRHYAKLRARDNLVVCVGGGVGTEEQATAYLTGAWVDERFPGLGLPAMPVDAVFLGTRLMATKEAKTSPAVKRALAAAAGELAQWPTDGGRAGGVTSGKSSLDAPIYYLDNAAARCGRLLDEVAGDADKVAARRDEIVEALARTAKPYFGDVEAMTPAELLARARALLTPDGLEADVTWRSRMEELERRCAARYGDDLGSSLLHPEDARFFLEVCKRPGKPVPFVPVLDADVRRWFKSDSLWQSHDDRFAADAVFAIPGPAAVAAIRAVDEPVADVLRSFVAHATSAVSARAAAPATLARAGAARASVGDARLERARTLPFAVDDNGLWHKNPLQGAPPSCVRLDAESGRLVAELVHGDAALDLCLRLVDDDHGGWLAWDRERYLDAQHRFYSRAMFGEDLEPVPLFEEAREPVVIDAARVRAFRAATGDDNPASTRAPLPTAFSFAWRAVFRALAGARPDVVRLVHESEEARGPGFDCGEHLTACARVRSVEGVEGGTRVVVDGRLVRADGGVAAETESRFFIRQSVGAPAPRRERRSVQARLDVGAAELAFLRAKPFVTLDAALGAPCALVLDATVTEAEAAGAFTVDGREVGRLHIASGHDLSTAVSPGAALDALVDLLEGPVGESAQVPLAQEALIGIKSARAPAGMAAYAEASGDKNPLHVDANVARLAGFTQPIVHGMWTASMAVHRIARLAADGDASRVRRATSTFLAPVLPRTPLSVEVKAVAKRAGATVVQADVKDENDVVVVRTLAEVAPRTTAYVFPGQGVQHAGMGMESYAQSAAARAVWDEADAVCQSHHGFSLLHVVRDNPRELWVKGERLVHPEGVLFLTQLTQVALAVMAVADVAALKEQGALVEGAPFAGHSLGEYSALASVPAVMPLAGVVDIVYERGRTMDRLVSRDAAGRSPYGMGAVRPNLAGLDESAALALVDDVAREAGLPLFVVNHNVRGRQYAVTGDVRALAALKQKLAAIQGGAGKPAFVDVPGIDVPFHSPLLRDGVPAFRARLDAVLPERVEPALLEGRYVPNLTGTLFRLSPAFLSEVLDASGSPRVAEWLSCFDETAADRPRLARMLLVEVLAYQFASPVRWTDVQDVLLRGAHAVGDVVEVGPAKQPVLSGMAKAGGYDGRSRVLHAVLDKDVVLGTALVEEDPVAVPPAPASASGVGEQEGPGGGQAAAPRREAPAAPQQAAVAAPVPLEPARGVGPLPEARPWVEDALVTLLCVVTKKAREEIDLSRSLDHLLGGNSARRNQVLAEIGAELGARAVDNAHEMPLATLASTISKTSTATGPGAVLKPLQDQAAHKLLGHDLGRFDDLLAKEWELPPAHRERLKNRLALRARAGGKSDGVVEELVRAYGAELGVAIEKKRAAAGGAAVDSAALDALEARVLGKDGALARAARVLRDAVEPGAVDGVVVDPAAGGPALDDREHDEAYFQATRAVFDARKHAAFRSSWAWARRDLLDDALPPARVAGRLDAAARALAAHMLEEARRDGDASRVERLEAVLAVSAVASVFAGRTALVTGAGPGSIARSVVARLLAGGARVIVTTSRPDAARSFKALYQEHAALGAELHVVPANQGSFADVDDLVRFLAEPQKERVGSVDRVAKPPMVPDLVIPFGAVAETADLLSMGPRSLTMFRVLVLGVERLVARVAELHAARGTRAHVILPLSPNHGTFGGDGAYGECKAALEALLDKQRSEAWGKNVAVVGARIGWVRGTGLMHKNDGAATFLEERGLKTFSGDEMADAVVALMDDVAAARAPFVADLTGGLGAVPDLAGLMREYRDRVAADARLEARRRVLDEAWARVAGAAAGSSTSKTAPLARQRLRVPVPCEADLALLPQLDHLDLDELIVVVGTGEVSPWGSARTRWAIEKDAKLSIEAVLELAWMMGLVRPDDKGAGFVDAASGERVADDEVIAKYEEHVLAHAGVRVIEPAVTGFDPRRTPRLVEVHLERDFRFPVPTRETAAAMVEDDPEGTVVVDDGGALFVVKRAGSVVRVPAAFRLHRAVAGQIPTGWDAARLGVPKELCAQVDPVTLYCLVSTAEAFLAAGLTPEELFAHLHPGRAGVTIGTGIGGMTKLKKLYRDFYDGADRQNDALQETLINVIGGYVVQSFLGSYGPMSFPVGACATGGLSLSEAVDKIKTGQADLVVAGGADDLSEAGNLGFGDMGATADTDDLAARGVEPRFMSRPNDARRRGFVESQGAGVVVVCRASLAVKLALPVYGVVAFAGTSGDGLQKSVPAPGQGALALATEDRTDPVDHTACDLELRRRAARELDKRRPELARLLGAAQADAIVAAEKRRLAHDFMRDRRDISPLRGALAVLGLVADDVGVVSKHDSSTQANDLNEARLHETMMTSLGRAPHKPLFVISQKSLTGHPKGAAAAWQMNGLLQAMADGVVPGNASLDDVDDDMRAFGRLVWSDRATRLPWHALKAGVVTTLGFGHVSALVCLAHPFLFWRALAEDVRADYAARMEARRRSAEQRLQRVLSGRAPLFVPRERPAGFGGDVEARALLDAGGRA